MPLLYYVEINITATCIEYLIDTSIVLSELRIIQLKYSKTILSTPRVIRICQFICDVQYLSSFVDYKLILK